MPYDPTEIFRCTGCGECCKGYGGTVISEADLERIADYTGIDVAYLRTDYLQISGDKWMIAQGNNGYCIFWNSGCSIHPVKPRMCREWPFIEGVLKDVLNWQVMAGACPGIRVDIPDTDVIYCVRQALKKP